MSTNCPSEDHLYEFMHKHGQWMEDIEAHLGVLHNSFMEVNNRLNNLDTGHCRCRDVPLSPVLDEPLVSPSISAVGGGEEVVPLMTMVDEDEVPLPLWVCGVRKLDLSHLCFSLNFYFLMFLSQFPSMFLLLTYFQSFFSLSAGYPRHSRQRRSKIQFN